MQIYNFVLDEAKNISPLDQFGHKIQEVVMPILVLENDSLKILGTGFTINSDGIMVTAKHVISGYLHPNDLEKDHFELYCLYISSKQDSESRNYFGGFMPIKIAWYSEELDIAYCWIERPILDGVLLELPVLGLSPGIPKVGEKLFCFGYYKSNAILDKNKFLVHYSQNTGLTHGKITEIYTDKRDRISLNFPCFEADCKFNSGMSGAPVFNSTGHVCGVVCSSYDLGEGEVPLSFSSMIWPSITTPITVNFKQGDVLEKVRIYELIEKGLIYSDETFSKICIDTSDKEIVIIGFNG